MKKVKGYWFSAGYTLPNGDGRPVTVGVTHSVEGKIEACENGLHSSIRAIDALQYAHGPIVWIVESWGDVSREDDKLAARNRTYLAGGIDISKTLRSFARRCALDVAGKWDCPPVVRQWLETGDESIREAAEGAAWSAAESAARSAARSAAERAAWSAAGSAAWSAAESAARSAAESAERSAAWSAALDKYNGWLEAMIAEAIKPVEVE